MIPRPLPCHPLCAIAREYGQAAGHAGPCDTRPARERGAAMMAMMKRGLRDDALTEAIGAEARASWLERAG